jgi:hypothetical protein
MPITGRLEPDPAQQAALTDMQALAAQGLASRAIAAAVQERHGIAVSHVTVRAALARGSATGKAPPCRTFRHLTSVCGPVMPGVALVAD